MADQVFRALEKQTIKFDGRLRFYLIDSHLEEEERVATRYPYSTILPFIGDFDLLNRRWKGTLSAHGQEAIGLSMFVSLHFEDL